MSIQPYSLSTNNCFFFLTSDLSLTWSLLAHSFATVRDSFSLYSAVGSHCVTWQSTWTLASFSSQTTFYRVPRHVPADSISGLPFLLLCLSWHCKSIWLSIIVCTRATESLSNAFVTSVKWFWFWKTLQGAGLQFVFHVELCRRSTALGYNEIASPQTMNYF